MNSPARCIVTLSGLLTVLTTLVAAGQVKLEPNEKIPRIQFESIPLTAGIENLARQAGLNYALSSVIPEPNVTKAWKNVSAETALTNLLAEHKLFLIASPATSVKLISTTNRIATPVDAKWVAADTNQPLPLIRFAEVPLQTALTKLARQSGVTTLSVDPRINTPLTVRWENLKPRQALGALCEAYNLVLTTNTAGGIRIAPK